MKGPATRRMRPCVPQRWVERARKRFKQTRIGPDLRGDGWLGFAGKSCCKRGGGVGEGKGRFLHRVAVCRETSLLRENEICSQEGGGVAADAAVIGHAFAF